jgi:hypothetical protein
MLRRLLVCVSTIEWPSALDYQSMSLKLLGLTFVTIPGIVRYIRIILLSGVGGILEYGEAINGWGI